MKRSIVILLAFGLFITTAAYAKKYPGQGPRHSQMMEQLKLTDTQKDQFEKIRFETQKKNIELRAKLETSRLELRRFMSAENQDKSAIEKKINEVSSTQAAMKMNHFNSWFERNKILTPEQQKVWKKALMNISFRQPRHPKQMGPVYHERIREEIRK